MLDQLILKMRRITRQDLDHIYNEEFVSTPYCNKPWADAFCDLLIRTFQPVSVMDVGCGTGDILAPFEKRGLRVLGLDGSRVCQRHSRLSPTSFRLFDLRNEFPHHRRFDLCLCLEVAEHVDDRFSDRLIETVTGASDTVVFTAAPPGQTGPDHINLQPYEYWISKFEKRGFRLDPDATARLKDDVARIPGVEWWYIKNLMIFRA